MCIKCEAKLPTTYREDLENCPACECSDAECDAKGKTAKEFGDGPYLSPSCHPGSGLSVHFSPTTGCLIALCGECESFVVKIKVASDGRIT